MHLAPLNAPGGACDWPLHAVVAHAGAYGVVVSRAKGRAWVAAIQHQFEPRDRSDVLVDEISDLAAMALPGGRYLIRTARARSWTSGVVVGRCTPIVAKAISAALKREVEACAHEGKWREAS